MLKRTDNFILEKKKKPVLQKQIQRKTIWQV